MYLLGSQCLFLQQMHESLTESRRWDENCVLKEGTHSQTIGMVVPVQPRHLKPCQRGPESQPHPVHDQAVLLQHTPNIPALGEGFSDLASLVQIPTCETVLNLEETPGLTHVRQLQSHLVELYIRLLRIIHIQGARMVVTEVIVHEGATLM